MNSSDLTTSSKPRIYIYLHICCIEKYLKIINDILYHIKKSGLYDIIDEIRCGVLGEIYDKVLEDPKIVLRGCSSDLSLYESFTLNKMLEDSKTEDFYCLYLHSKGVTRGDNPFVKSWVDYLCYFDIYCHKKCIELLENNDTVGVNLQDKEGEKCHYSGNFWWSKSSYIKRLDKVSNLNYNDPEFWLTMRKMGKYASLWNSNANHYHEMYHEENYKNKGFREYCFDYTS
jgi:hypothetical protein